MTSYNDINHYFETSGFEELKSILNSDWGRDFVSSLRNDLDLCGKKCDFCRYMIEQMDVVDIPLQSINSENYTTPISQKWQQLTKTHRSVFELFGFALLLKMDATAMLISLMSPMSDVEKKVLGKHAYTIVAEARNKDLFSILSARMKEYPDWALSSEDYETLWTDKNKKLLRDVTSNKKSISIRNAIDAHKHGFEEQLDIFKSVDWRQSVIDMIRLIQVVNNIEVCINGINKRIDSFIENFDEETHNYIAQLDNILSQLEEFES